MRKETPLDPIPNSKLETQNSKLLSHHLHITFAEDFPTLISTPPAQLLYNFAPVNSRTSFSQVLFPKAHDGYVTAFNQDRLGRLGVNLYPFGSIKGTRPLLSHHLPRDISRKIECSHPWHIKRKKLVQIPLIGSVHPILESHTDNRRGVASNSLGDRVTARGSFSTF